MGAWVIQPRKVTVGGNALLVKRLSRREAAAFTEAMKAAGDDASEQERAGLKLIAANVTFEDGTPISVDDVPADDLITLLRAVVNGEAKGVADFTGTP
jgi:hypothetical protein